MRAFTGWIPTFVGMTKLSNTAPMSSTHAGKPPARLVSPKR